MTKRYIAFPFWVLSDPGGYENRTRDGLLTYKSSCIFLMQTRHLVSWPV